MMYNYL